MELTDFFACWHKFTKIIGVNIVKNGCGQSCDSTLKLTVSEEWTNGVNWFFAYRFTKIDQQFFTSSDPKIFCNLEINLWIYDSDAVVFVRFG